MGLKICRFCGRSVEWFQPYEWKPGRWLHTTAIAQKECPDPAPGISIKVAIKQALTDQEILDESAPHATKVAV